MSNLTPSERPLTPDQAYTAVMREAHAEQHVRLMAAAGPYHFEQTKSDRIAETYKVSAAWVRQLKARERAEFGGGGK